MRANLNRRSCVHQVAAFLYSIVASAGVAQADIYQWEYINPADPSQGKRQSTTLAPAGAGVDAVPGADLHSRNLTMAYLIGADLRGASVYFATLTDADLSQANLTNANFYNTTLTDANFTGAEVRGAVFYRDSWSGVGGITLLQLYSTASYQAHDLSGIDLGNNNLAGGNFVGQILTNATFYYGTLTDADLRETNLANAYLPYATLTGADLRQANLTNANFGGADLTGANFRQANLANSSFVYDGCSATEGCLEYATLTDADFTDAEVRGADFYNTGITLAQLYSTASYQSHDLTGIHLGGYGNDNLVGGNFVGQNLTNASFYGAWPWNTDFTDSEVRGASFGKTQIRCDIFCSPFQLGSEISLTQLYSTASYQERDIRGVSGVDSPIPPSTNLILPDGHVNGLDLDAGGLLVVRDYDGNPRYFPLIPIPITVDQHLSMGPGGTLRMVFEADAWDSTISFAPGIPVTLGGTLELTFADDVNLASQVGRSFDLFNWTGVNPTGAFAISSPYAWDLSNLYTTGEVTLTAIPEPSSAFLALGFVATIPIGRRIVARNHRSAVDLCPCDARRTTPGGTILPRFGTNGGPISHCINRSRQPTTNT